MSSVSNQHSELAERVRKVMRDGCSYSCGCDHPGNPSRCIYAEDFDALDSLVEQLEAAQRERSHLAQRARSFFIDYEDDCPHPVAMFLDDISVDPASNPASEPVDG